MTKQERLERVRSAGDALREALLDVWENQDWLPEYVNLAQYLQAELGYSLSRSYQLQEWVSDLSGVSESSTAVEQSDEVDKSDTEWGFRQTKEREEGWFDE